MDLEELVNRILSMLLWTCAIAGTVIAAGKIVERL